MTFRFHLDARVEYFDILDWYDARHAGSGDRFADRFTELFRRVLSQPRMYERVARPPRGRDVRRALTTGFPFVAVYEITPTEIVFLSVTHARSRRQTWRRRL